MFGWFKSKKESEVVEQATEIMVEALVKDVKKPKHIDCECKDCIKRIKQNAK